LRCRTGADGEPLRRIDDGVGVHAVVAVEIVDGAGLAEMLDAQRYPRFDLLVLEPHSSAPNMMEYTGRRRQTQKQPRRFQRVQTRGNLTPCSATPRKATRIPATIMREKITIGMPRFTLICPVALGVLIKRGS
jgi:hypothetical protein